jgi:RimJ/RimL family protein N-acetyltransferase
MKQAGQPKVKFKLENNKLAVTIKTDNLCLKSVQEKDEEFYYTELYCKPEVMKSFTDGNTKDLQTVQTMVKTWADRWQNNDPFSAMTIREQESEDFIGQITLGYGNGEKLPGVAEVGYIISTKQQGKGYASEAALAVTGKYARELMERGYKVNNGKLTSIVATARTTGNIPSNKVLEKCGFEKEGEGMKDGYLRNFYRKNVTVHSL